MQYLSDTITTLKKCNIYRKGGDSDLENSHRESQLNFKLPET